MSKAVDPLHEMAGIIAALTQAHQRELTLLHTQIAALLHHVHDCHAVMIAIDASGALLPTYVGNATGWNMVDTAQNMAHRFKTAASNG